MSKSRPVSRVIPLFEGRRKSWYLNVHYFLSKQDDDLFESVITCDGQLVFQQQIDSDYGLTGIEGTKWEGHNIVNDRIRAILSQNNIDTPYWWSVSENTQFVVTDELTHSIAVSRIRAESEASINPIKSMQSVISLGLWLEDVVLKSKQGDYGSATELLFWYLKNVPLAPPYFGSFKKIAKAILRTDTAILTNTDDEHSHVQSFIEILAITTARLDRDLHRTVTRRMRIADFQMKDGVSVEKPLFLDAEFLSQSAPHIYIDSEEARVKCQALVTLLNMESHSISQRTQGYLQRMSLRLIQHLQSINKDAFDIFAKNYLEEFLQIQHKNPRVRRAIERDSLVLSFIVNNISQDIISEHKFCIIDTIALRYVENLKSSDTFDVCNDCLTYAINETTSKERNVALQILLNEPRKYLAGKFNFRSEDIPKLLSGGLENLPLLALYRLKNFGASAKLFDYFEGRTPIKMSDLELAIYAIHKMTEPKHYYNKISRLFTTKPKFAHRSDKMNFHDSHKQQQQMVQDIINFLQDPNLASLLTELVHRDAVITELLRTEDYWATYRIEENHQSSRIWLQNDVLQLLLPMLLNQNLSDTEVANLIQLIDLQVVFYSLKESRFSDINLVEILNLIEALSVKLPASVSTKTLHRFVIKLFESQELEINTELLGKLLENKTYVEILMQQNNLGEFNVLRQLDLLDLAIHHKFDGSQLLKLFNNSIPVTTSWAISEAWSQRILGELGDRVADVPEIRQALLELIAADENLLNKSAYRVLFLATIASDARSGIDLKPEMLNKYLKILFQERGDWVRGQSIDSLGASASNAVIPNDALVAFANTPLTLSLIVKKLIREAIPISYWTNLYLTNESLVANLLQVNSVISEDTIGVITELLNDFYLIRNNVTSLALENEYLEFKVPLQDSTVNQALLKELFDEVIDGLIELSDENLDSSLDIFALPIKEFDFKITRRLLLHNDVRVQSRMLQILIQNNEYDNWWMFLAESGSPTLMESARSYVIETASDEVFRQKLLDLLDSSVEPTRALAFQILHEANIRVNLSDLVQKLAEHPAPDVWEFVLRHYSDLQQSNSKSSLLRNVFLSRRVARQIKIDLMNLVQQDPEKEFASPYVSRMSLSRTRIDNEFALKFMAKNPEYFEEIDVEDVWSDL